MHFVLVLDVSRVLFFFKRYQKDMTRNINGINEIRYFEIKDIRFTIKNTGSWWWIVVGEIAEVP